MTTNKVHDPENKNCLFNFYSHAHVGVSECKMCPCTCEKQQQAPQEPTPTSEEKDNRPEAVLDRVLIRAGKIPPTKEAPTSVTEEEWEKRFDEAREEKWRRFGISWNDDDTYSFIANELKIQRTHIKQALLGRVETEARGFINEIAMQLRPSNDTMEAVRLFRKELPNFIKKCYD